jgi:hypothetical protein
MSANDPTWLMALWCTANVRIRVDIGSHVRSNPATGSLLQRQISDYVGFWPAPNAARALHVSASEMLAIRTFWTSRQRGWMPHGA